MSTFNKIYTVLIRWSFEMPNAPYSQRCAQAKMRHIIIIFTLIALTSCVSKKGVDFCGTHLLSESDWVDSKITDIKTIGIADTTIAFLSGQVFGNSLRNDTTLIDTLIFAAVSFKHPTDTTGNGTSTELDGKYNLTLSAGTYDIAFNYIGFNTIIIRNLTLGTGEMKELNVTLGEGHGTTEYVMTDNNQYERQVEKNKTTSAQQRTVAKNK